jgi:hypothetical protein
MECRLQFELCVSANRCVGRNGADSYNSPSLYPEVGDQPTEGVSIALAAGWWSVLLRRAEHPAAMVALLYIPLLLMNLVRGEMAEKPGWGCFGQGSLLDRISVVASECRAGSEGTQWLIHGSILIVVVMQESVGEDCICTIALPRMYQYPAALFSVRLEEPEPKVMVPMEKVWRGCYLERLFSSLIMNNTASIARGCL